MVKNQITHSDSNHTMVSVIIPAKNVEGFLPGCIRAVRTCAYPQDRVEIIVVDNGSTDSSLEIAMQMADKVLRVPDVTIAALRNRGALEATGEVLAFLDADCVASDNWLTEGVRAVSERECLAGFLYDVPEDANWMERDWFGQRDNGVTETTHVGGGNMFISHSLFQQASGFDEKLITGEDYEFCLRVSQIAKIISDDRIKVIHLGNPKNIIQFIKREIWYGMGALGSFKLKRFDKPLIGTLIFLSLTVIQILSLIGLLFSLPVQFVFCLSSLMLILLLFSTLLYRRRYIRGFRQMAALFFLYYLYYLGRSISFLYFLVDKNFYHDIKKERSLEV
ncbi:MAG TPA: glycosyltransferase [Oligoflexia bacterium]|nr:glycosyltransferase [Oligoflexia bacterium]HMP47050.1 glycosyltransferase [Oligoflexia bacterium]